MFGVPIDDLTMVETLAWIDVLVTGGRRSGRTHQISTVNVDFLVNALDDSDVASILQQADVCLADGMPVVWGSRLLGMPIRQRVAGSDLVPLLIEASQTNGHHVHIFGSAPDVADAARSMLEQRYPSARFSIDSGPMMSDVKNVDPAVLDSIAEVDADVLCVALGNPKQEHFIQAHRDRLGTPVMIGIGGSLDMLVGKRRRAPRWVQSIGLEWVVRAIQEPKRLGRRYAHDIRVFGPALTRAWNASRRRRHCDGLHLHVATETVVARFAGTDIPTLDEWQRAAQALRTGSQLLLDAVPGAQPTNRAAAQLVGLAREARRYPTPIRVIEPDAALLAALRAHKVRPELFGLDHDVHHVNRSR
jgi:N-acetylglucosaminyldiphosphoundecaprenol N-acetyl-beta-D-mannosaminyltransferase